MERWSSLKPKLISIDWGGLVVLKYVRKNQLGSREVAEIERQKVNIGYFQRAVYQQFLIDSSSNSIIWVDWPLINQTSIINQATLLTNR